MTYQLASGLQRTPWTIDDSRHNSDDSMAFEMVIDLAGSVNASAVVLHPVHILAVWLGDIQLECGGEWRVGSRIAPPVDFGMTIGEGEVGGFTVITGRKVNHDGLRHIRVTVHLHDKEAVVDAILPLFQKHKSHCRSGPGHVSQLAKDLEVGACAPASARV